MGNIESVFNGGQRSSLGAHWLSAPGDHVLWGMLNLSYIEILYVTIIHRVLWKWKSMKSGRGVTCIPSVKNLRSDETFVQYIKYPSLWCNIQAASCLLYYQNEDAKQIPAQFIDAVLLATAKKIISQPIKAEIKLKNSAVQNKPNNFILQSMSPVSPVFHIIGTVRLSLNSIWNKTPSPENEMSMLVSRALKLSFLLPPISKVKI